jgi:ribosomal protein S27AE
MSADNWARCPRCADDHAKDVERAQAALDASYGKVPLDQFDKMRAEVASLRASTPPETFREDYEFYGAEDGEVVAEYRGQCSKCGLSVKFQDSHPFYASES